MVGRVGRVSEGASRNHGDLKEHEVASRLSKAGNAARFVHHHCGDGGAAS
jgi:hypothetical protein